MTFKLRAVDEKLKLSIFAKGGDRTIQNLPRSEVETCQKHGIKIVTGVGGGKVQSSSWIIENLKKLITQETGGEIKCQERGKSGFS